ncbi:NAD-dependent epimerase/dehydratase family protein [Spirosoma gilvum]
MTNCTVLILGGSGFVGAHIVDVFSQNDLFRTLSTSRQPTNTQFYFDILDPVTWQSVIEAKPDYIIEATGYGVVKEEANLDLLYQINYIKKTEFIDFVFKKLPDVFWIQIGTAFEYSLELESLLESSFCFPKTHYGISKSLFSTYLRDKVKQRYCIVRPFGMFGEAEAASKFFPMLILAQKEKRVINLSDGSQQRDYFYVKDLGSFLRHLIESGQMLELAGQIINVGSGNSQSLRQLSQLLAEQIPNFDPIYWKWGIVAQRSGENALFYNASSKAAKLGLITTQLEKAFQKTVNYYYYGGSTITV